MSIVGDVIFTIKKLELFERNETILLHSQFRLTESIKSAEELAKRVLVFKNEMPDFDKLNVKFGERQMQKIADLENELFDVELALASLHEGRNFVIAQHDLTEEHLKWFK